MYDYDNTKSLKTFDSTTLVELNTGYNEQDTQEIDRSITQYKKSDVRCELIHVSVLKCM